MGDMEKISGVFPAVSTPLLADGSVDLDRMAAHCRVLLDDGATGLAVLGTTGEANSFSVSERCGLVEGLIARGISADVLLPGTGTCAVPDTVALIRHGLALGVQRFLVLPPFYYKGASDEGLFASFAQVVEQVADARLQVVLYNFPAMSGVPISQGLVARLRRAFPSVFVGMKDSTGDVAHGLARIAANPGFSLLAGTDPLMLPLLAAGGAGCITAMSNVAAHELAFVYANFGDAARVAPVQARIEAMRKLAVGGVQLTNIKAMLARRYGDDGWLRVRVPFIAPDAAQVKYVAEGMAAIDRQFPFERTM